MELWIRSQDRTTLIRSYEIYISEQQNTYLIRAKRTSHILGVYNTFERALEVLDEINTIKYYKYMAELDWVSFTNGVLKEKPMEEQKTILSMMNTYEMPKE